MKEYYGENHRAFTCDESEMWLEAINELKRLDRVDPRNVNDLTEN